MRNPFSAVSLSRKFESWTDMIRPQKRPLVGLTQGGSSRDNEPAVVAARNVDIYRNAPKEEKA